MKKALLFGIIASFFFAFTFILNRQMSVLSGGSWFWSASLRYFFMLPVLFTIVAAKKQLSLVINEIRRQPMKWFLWSTTGFGIFYAPLCYASEYGASWLIAGTWQITIVAGALMSPLFYKTIDSKGQTLRIRNKIPIKTLLFSSVILLGIFFLQFGEAKSSNGIKVLFTVIPVIIAAFAYPLGNRKMIEICSNRLSTYQRVFGMVLCSMPFWIILSTVGALSAGFPSSGQIFQSFIVAIFSGIIATVLFFKATDLVNSDIQKLAVVESTQSGEVIFTLIGSILFFNDKMPTVIGLVGILLVVTGMILNCIVRR